MQVSVETTSGLERQVTVTVPAERIDNDVNQRVQHTARTVRMDGFRPGKVPLKVVKKRYGQGIRAEVLNQVIQETLFEATSGEKLTPAGTPNIDLKVDNEGEDLQYVATFEVYPEVELADYSGVEIEKQSASVEEADIDTMLDTLRKQQAAWNAVERAAVDGDQVNMDFVGSIDGEEFEGGKGEGMDLVLGSGSFIPGFEAQLVGLSAGEEKSVEVSFPEDYHAEDLKGKPAVFAVKVNTVSEQELPELNAEFFAKFGIEGDSEESFRTEVRGNMEREMSNTLKMKLKSQAFGQLVEINSIDVPASLVDGEIDNLRRQQIQQFAGPDADIDINMLPKEMFVEQAEKRVATGLLIQEFVKANELKVDDARVQDAIKELSETYQDPQQVIDWYNSNEEMMNQMRNLVMEDQVLDQLLSSATVTEANVSYEEALKPAAPAAEEASEEAAE